MYIYIHIHTNIVCTCHRDPGAPVIMSWNPSFQWSLGSTRDFLLFSQKATVQLNAIRAKTRTATAKDVEALHFFGATDAGLGYQLYIYIPTYIYIYIHTYYTYSLPFDNACFALFFPDFQTICPVLNNSSTYVWNLLLYYL